MPQAKAKIAFTLLAVLALGVGCAIHSRAPAISTPADDVDTGATEHVWFMCDAAQRTRCRGSIFLPRDAKGAVPVIVMAHGFSFTREYLAPYAKRFAQAGYGVLTFDYRFHGNSEGEPRHYIDPLLQLDDWRAAIDHAKARTDVFDATKVVLWGTSYSGGHVLVMASERKDLRAVISQVADTGESLDDQRPISFTAKAVLAIGWDKLLGLFGKNHYVAVAGPPGTLAGLTLASETQELQAVIESVKPHHWENRITASTLVRAAGYRPNIKPENIKVPVLLFSTTQDKITPAAGIARVAQGIADHQLVQLDGGHFSVYLPPLFDTTTQTQIEFLNDKLKR